MAQTVLQVSGLRHDPEHADVQGFQQTAILRGVSRIVLSLDTVISYTL